MKNIFSFLVLLLAVNLFVQCKTDHKKQTAQEPTKPTVTKIENKQDAASAIISASQTFANADCQGNATCQSVQTQAAVLASADPSQLATVLTPDNIQQATAEITNSTTVTATSITTDTETSTNTNTEQNTNVNTNTSVSVSKSSRGSPAMKNAGISLMVLGGALFVVGVSVLRYENEKHNLPSDYLEKIQSSRSLSDFPRNQEIPKVTSTKDIIQEFKEHFSYYKEGESFGGHDSLDQKLFNVDAQVDMYLNGKDDHQLDLLRNERKHLIGSGDLSRQLEFDYAIEQVEIRLEELSSLGIERAKILKAELGKIKIEPSRNFDRIRGKPLMKSLDSRISKLKPEPPSHQGSQDEHQIVEGNPPERKGSVVEEHPRQSTHLEEPSSPKSYKTHGIAAAVFGVVVAAVGGGLYANSGVGLAEGTANDPLTVYFTRLGHIAQQLTP